MAGKVSWLGFFDVAVGHDERGFLFRDGQFVRFLEPGRFRAYDPKRRYKADVYNVVRTEAPLDVALLYEKTHPELASKHFDIVQPGANNVAIISLDGQPHAICMPNTTHAFWKTLTLVEVETIDTTEEFRVSKTHLDKMTVTGARGIVDEVVETHEAGLLFVDGALHETLQPGRHAFWAVGRTIRIKKVDLRPQALEVTAQEILTKDKINIRVTLTAFYTVSDAIKTVTEVGDVETTLYRLIQFAIREAVATRSLDEVLSARDQLDEQVRAFIRERSDALGVTIGEIGIKDVILPGDVRELLNKVVEAERTAKANLIRRQEETAATRSLLNTSKLMTDNPLLIRLKELEALEKLVEKVGRIDLHTGGQGGGFEALLSKLYRLEDQSSVDNE